MANPSLVSKLQKKTFHALGLLSLLILMQRAAATEFKVGGSKGWTVPTGPDAVTYNQWAQTNRFQIDDSLLFAYPADKDSVLRVSNDDYTNCNTARPIEVFKDGHTSFKFDQSGHYNFISGIKENCHKNEKMVVVVMAERSKGSSKTKQMVPTPPLAPPTPVGTIPPPDSIGTPVAAFPPPPGSTGIIPSPPANETLPGSPPPPGSYETIPSPSPFGEEPPPSEASSPFLNFIASIGAFIVSSLLVII